MLSVVLVAIALFLDFLVDYDPYWFNLLMSAMPYTFACAGFSYLSNLALSILIDLGKRRWMHSDARLRRMRRIIHICVAFINFAVFTQFLVIFIVTGDK